MDARDEFFRVESSSLQEKTHQFLRFGSEKDMIEMACSLATGVVKEGKVLVFTSTVNLGDIMGDQIRGRFNG
jgi:hypothetical protein